MKKILTVLLFLGAFTAAAEDSYLYWMVGEGAPTEGYNTVKVKANYDGGSTYLNIWNDDGVSQGDSVTKSMVDSHRAAGSGLYAGLGSNPAYTSFVIELYNGSDFFLDSETLSYSAALLANNIYTENSMALPSAWAPTAFSIPEPNSAMLLLLGCAALGLRRRRQLKA